MIFDNESKMLMKTSYKTLFMVKMLGLIYWITEFKALRINF